MCIRDRLNAIGLQNPGIDVFVSRDIPFLKKYDTKIIVNVCGKSTEDYCEVVERLSDCLLYTSQNYLESALKLKASSAEDYAGLGYIYFLKEDYTNAEKNLQKAVDEKYEKALLELGQVYACLLYTSVQWFVRQSQRGKK